MTTEFAFLNPGQLIDDDLELVLTKKVPADPVTGFFPDYKFEMKNRNTGEKVGHIDLRVGTNESIMYGGHIGYGVDEKWRGRHYAARACRLLFPLAKEHGLNPLYITCNPENTASRKTAELAGGTLMDIVDLPEHNDQYKRGERQKARYKFDL